MAKKLKLIVGGRKLEGTVSSEMRLEMDALGILSYKVSDRFHTGIPDIYIPSGQWIESKVVPRLPTKIAPPIRYFSGPQKKEIRKLTAAGEEVYAAIFFQFDMESRAFVMAPWWEFERVAQWDLDTIQSLGHIIPANAKPDYHMRDWFTPCKQQIHLECWDEKFKAWLDRCPEKFDEKKHFGRWPSKRYTEESDEPGHKFGQQFAEIPGEGSD